MSERASVWAKLRIARFAFDGYACTECGKAGTNETLEADVVGVGRKDYRYRVNSITVGELVTLCRSCFVKRLMSSESAEVRQWVESIKALP